MNKPWDIRNAEYTAKALAELADSYTAAPICYRDMPVYLEDDHPDGKPGCYVICLGEWIRGNDWPELKAAIDHKLRLDRVCAGGFGGERG